MPQYTSSQDLEFTFLGIATQKGVLETVVGAGGRRGGRPRQPEQAPGPGPASNSLPLTSTQNVLPFFSRYHIGWYSMGLCAGGPTQAQYPWNWPIGSPIPREWFHCFLYPDGTPYRAGEILMIQDFKYQAPPEFVRTQSYWAYGDSPEIKDVSPLLL